VGMINLSHFGIFDISGPDAESLLEYLAVAKVGGKTKIGKGIYTHFLEEDGGVHSDLTIIRLTEDCYRMVCGGGTAPRDLVWVKRMAQARGADIHIEDRSDSIATLGLWGPNARKVLSTLVDDPATISDEGLPFANA